MKLTYPIYILLIAVLLLSPVLQPASASPQVIIRYAVPHGLSSGACDSWATACDLNHALSGAQPGEQVWAATGVYTPTLRTDPTDPRSATFSLNPGVALYGGFNPAVGADTFAERNWQAYPTTLSGDLKGDGNPDYTLDEFCEARSSARKLYAWRETENAYHVLSSRGVTETAVLDGLIVSGGFAVDDFDEMDGGGMLVIDSSPTIANSIFQENHAFWGGGIDDNVGSIKLSNVVFRKNMAYLGGGYLAGGYRGREINAFPPGRIAYVELEEVRFEENEACEYGGGMYSVGPDSIHLNGVIFEKNQTSDTGGGMHMEHASSILENVIFRGNSALNGDGGGLSKYGGGSLRLENVAFIGNSAHTGGGGMLFENDADLHRVTFNGNFAGEGGGGLYSFDAVTLTDVTFINNSSGGDGGGLGGFDVSMMNASFTGNSSGEDGGGACNRGQSILVNVRFRDNQAAKRGGGMLIHSGSMQNVAFEGNSAGQGGGLGNTFNGYMYNPDILRLSNVTFRDNGATLQGGAIYHSGDSEGPDRLEISNSLLWGNSAPSGAEFYADPIYTNTLTALRYSLVQGGCPPGVACDHLLDADPLFVDDGPYGGLCLSSASPAVDAGDNTAVLSDTLDLDSDGDLLELTPFSLGGWLRFIDLPILDTGNGTPPLVDLGAYESPCPVYAIYFPWLSR